MKIELKLGKEYKPFNGQPQRVVDDFLLLSKEVLTGEIQDETPVDNGDLQRSWKPTLTKNKLVVSNSRKYALFVEKGTGIFGPRRHRIFPQTAQVLHWNYYGEDRYATNVRGQPGRHMAEKGFMKYRKQIPNLFRTSIIRNSNKGGR